MGRCPKKELLERLRKVLDQRPEILESYLFGSTARGEQQPHSDVDVAVQIERDSCDREAFGYRSLLTEDQMKALGSDRVDVVLLNHASPLLYARVLRDGIRLTSRDLRATTVREGRALSRYCDFVPQLAKIDAAHRQRIACGEFGR